MEKRNDLDEQMREIAGGNYGEDFWFAVKKFGNNPAAIREAAHTNTCPVCRQQIIPDAEACEPTDFLLICVANTLIFKYEQ